MSSLRALSIAAVAVIVVATSGTARADEVSTGAPRAGAWEAAAGTIFGRTRVNPTASDDADSNSGGLYGLNGSIAYFPSRRVGIAFELALLAGIPRACAADTTCYNHLAEDQTVVTIGPRWRPNRAVFLQASAGVTVSTFELYGTGPDHWLSPTAMLSSGLSILMKPLRIGIEARASAMRNEHATVTNLGLALTIGTDW
jgi:hypothetical protein